MSNSMFKKYAAFFALMLIVTSQLHSQPRMVWRKLFGSTNGGEYVLNEVIDNKGNLYVAGKTTGDIENKNFGKNDGFLTKIDSSGKVIWSRQFGTPEEEDVQWCAIDKTGNLFVTGFTSGDLVGKNSGKEDFFIFKYSQDGQLMWSRQFGTDSTDIAKGVYADNKGNVFITGVTGGKMGEASYGKNDAFIMKLDKNGNKIFTKQFGTTGDDFCYSITSAKSSEILVCGTTWGDLAGKNKGFIDAFTGQFTTDGQLIKFDQFGTDGFDIGMIAAMDKEGNIYAGGTTSGNFGTQQIGEGDAYLLKLNGKGEILWNSQFGTAMNDGVRNISFDPDKTANVLISGIVSLPPGKGFIRMYKPDGSLTWEKIFEDNTSGKDAKYDNKGNAYHVGLTGNDYYVVKLKL
jgi:hypothetical protein